MPEPNTDSGVEARPDGRKKDRPNRISLTEVTVKQLSPKPTEVIYWDEKTTGFGLRVTPKGKKTFLIQYRFRQADGKLKERQEKIGR